MCCRGHRWQGFLTGKYQRGTSPAPDTRAGSVKGLYQYVSADYAASDRIAAADLTLDGEATAVLDKVSTPTSGDYPYGAFGAGQRDRRLHGDAQALGELVEHGSDHPLGQL